MESLRIPLHVLVIEDDPGDAELIRIALAGSTRPKFQVYHAVTLTQGLEHLKTGIKTDVLLLDLSLPDAGGEETVVRMRGAAPTLPIVIMTGFDDAEFAERMVALGAQDYLVKGDSSTPMIWRAIRYAIARMQQGLERESLVNELRASGEMKNKMFGILAHDLRNPIGAIGGHAEFTEMMEADILSERTKGSLAAIRESAAYMNGLIEDVLTMAVADASEIKLVRHRLDLGELARKAVGIGAVAAEKKRVRLTVEAATVWVDADAYKLEQVLNNMISNAVKFSKEGDVVTVRVAEGDGGVLFSVADLGAGIPEAVKVGLFKPFVKGRTGTAGERSNGLGLYICSRIVDSHGGRIEVATKEGEAHGTTFTVVIPGAEGPL